MKKKTNKEIIKVGNTFYKKWENGDTYTIKDLPQFLAFSLIEDVSEYRKGNKSLKEQIELEITTLNALTNTARFTN